MVVSGCPLWYGFYFYGGSEQVKMVHSFVYDGDQNKDFIRALGVRFDVPMREALYNRHVAFSCADGGVWSEPVQPLVGRRILTLDKNRKWRIFVTATADGRKTHSFL